MKNIKAEKILKYIMIGLAAIYCLYFLIVLLTAEGTFAQFAVGMLALITAPALVAILTIIGFVRYLLRRRDAKINADKPLAAFANITAFVTAVITLSIALAQFILSGVDVPSPISDLALSSHLIKMGLAFGALTLVSSVLGFVFQRIIGKIKNDARAKTAKYLRAAAIVLTAVIYVCVLVIPMPMGTYNDGGSKIYEAVLYEAIDWNRTQNSDGTPVHEENQQLRIYFFPTNCCEYDAKWEMKH